MSDPSDLVPIYHVLLIGIDQYPPRYNSLKGCVNDIDVMEQLLFDQPGIGIPPEQIRVTRLAASAPYQRSQSRFQAQTREPTKTNVVQALQRLAGPEVKSSDRVLIYYSGHGDEKRWQGSSVWHEALVPHDGQTIDYLYDVEMNALINAIAARTSDLTIVLDCCHSAGAERDLTNIEPQGTDRYLQGNDGPGTPPDLAELGLAAHPIGVASQALPMLQTLDPNYVVVVACQPDEKAGEGVYPGEPRTLGIFTYALLSLLTGRDAAHRAALRWADIWPELLDKVAARCAYLRRRPQHPWVIGRRERRIFGGPWEVQDVGYPITHLFDDRYQIAAGTLMGVTQAAEVAVYGSTPLRFPAIGSPEDNPVGHLRVIEAKRTSCTAVAVAVPFDLPPGGRGRLVKPGVSERLQVAIKPEDPKLAAILAQSPFLEIVAANIPDAEVEVIAHPDGGWTIGNSTEAVLASVPVGETEALRAGLESYYRYQTVLRMAHSDNDPQLNQRLSLELLDCSDTASLAAMSPEALADPRLREVERDAEGVYAVTPGARFCVKVSNRAPYTIKLTILNCSAGGLVEYLGDATLRKPEAPLNCVSHVLWMRGEPGRGFPATADKLPIVRPGDPGVSFVTDRILAIGATRADADLRAFVVEKTVQQVIDDIIARAVTEEVEHVSRAPAELWTTTVVPLRIAKQ